MRFANVVAHLQALNNLEGDLRMMSLAMGDWELKDKKMIAHLHEI